MSRAHNSIQQRSSHSAGLTHKRIKRALGTKRQGGTKQKWRLKINEVKEYKFKLRSAKKCIALCLNAQ